MRLLIALALLSSCLHRRGGVTCPMAIDSGTSGQGKQCEPRKP